jgi:hypothetical protein
MKTFQSKIYTDRGGSGTKVLKHTVGTVLTSAGVAGSAYGAIRVKDLVTEASGNEILGWAAGGATFLVGTAITRGISSGIENAIAYKVETLDLPALPNIPVPPAFNLASVPE